MTNVKIVSISALSANGSDKHEIFKSCLAQKTAVNEMGLAPISAETLEQLTPVTPAEFLHSRCTILSYRAVKDALTESGWTAEQLRDTGFIFASTTSQVDQWEKDLPFHREPTHDPALTSKAVFSQSIGSPLLLFQKYFGVRGPSAVVASSCSASLQALNLATLWIKQHKVKRVIVGSTEILSDLTTVGFGSLRLLSKGVCRPFSRDREGINLGEASAFICLEAAENLSASPWGFVSGVGFSTDSYHATSPHPEGNGSLAAMSMAVRASGLAPEQIDWIYTHGTGSPANDLAEAKSIKRLFAQNGRMAPVISSTKSLHGHTLGASGVFESVMALMAMRENLVLPTFNCREADPGIGLEVALKPLSKKIDHVLKNSLGFGGINASTIFSKQAVRL